MSDPRKQEYEDNKLAKRLRRLAGQAIGDFNMIGAGDRVMVCLSGGKDSYGLLDVLLGLREHAPIHFDILPFHLDQRHPGYPADVLPRYLTELGLKYHVEVQDTYSVVKRVVPEGKTMCGLCSRLRRGVIYRIAKELGATRIALGHHADDVLETFFLNLFFGGKLKAMPPKLVSDDGKHIVIRPLAYVRERDLARYADLRQFPIIPCDLCGSQETLQRKQMKEMIAQWERQHPGRIESMLRSVSDVRLSHLMDRTKFDFTGLEPSGQPDPAGDKVFDTESPLPPAVIPLRRIDAA
ncbi:MAG: tRNA 2-thiocytidine(32) synthetase TtcA [Betaproteobacteria bacterium]|nr:tRNA 2-thiocytidine(32) synthetase TtcA [Betaproteobacteria bacterium]